MNRIVELLRGQLAGHAEASDRQLLDRFLAGRDETAFAELVRRHGPVVWGVCRRQLANPHDAEDAFQATFLVLVRRATAISAKVPLGPWLHRVAAMTARNVIRGNRRRTSVSGPMEFETPARYTDLSQRLDLDAALLALPEAYRVPVVLCHLQGLSRREAAERLGCPEGTLSARLHRALEQLRSRLGAQALPALVIAGTVTAPAAISAATVHSASIDTTSTLTAAGLSPVVAGLTNGVIRMFWMKKLVAGLAFAVLAGGGLLAGIGMRSDGVAQANVPLASEPQAPPDDPDAAAKLLDRRLADLTKQKELLDATLAEMKAEKAKLDEAAKSKARAAEAAELGTDLAVVIENGKPSEYRVYEVVNGKIAEVLCSDLDILTTYLRRTFNDPKGPKKLRVGADKEQSYTQLREVLAACAAAGYMSASFSNDRPTGYYHRNASDHTLAVIEYHRALKTRLEANRSKVADPLPVPGEIDLRKYVPKKP